MGISEEKNPEPHGAKASENENGQTNLQWLTSGSFLTNYFVGLTLVSVFLVASVGVVALARYGQLRLLAGRNLALATRSPARPTAQPLLRVASNQAERRLADGVPPSPPRPEILQNFANLQNARSFRTSSPSNRSMAAIPTRYGDMTQAMPGMNQTEEVREEPADVETGDNVPEVARVVREHEHTLWDWLR